MASKRTQDIEIHFTPRAENQPEHLLASAELAFGRGLLAGLRLTGLALWRAQSDKGEDFIAVTVPSRPSGGNYYDHLRTQSGDIKDLAKFKTVLVKQYRLWSGDPAPAGAPADSPTGKEVPF